MLLNLVLIILLCLSARLYIYWSRVKRYWADRNVPYAPPHPVLGNLTFLFKENPALWFRNHYKTHKSPYVGIWMFWRPAIVINSYDLARRILINDSEVFRDRFVGSVTKDPFRHNLFLAKDPIWTFFRRRLTAVFTAARLRATHKIISKKSHELIQRINNDIDMKNKINIKTLFLDYTTDVISITSLGVESDAVLTGRGHMKNVATDMAGFSIHKGLSWISIFFFPEVADLFRFELFSKATKSYLRELFRSVVDHRGGYEANKTHILVSDMVDALVYLKQEAAKDGKDIDEDTLVAQVAILLLGGFETSAMAMTYCVYELAFAPYHIQENLYNEIIQAKERKGCEKIDATMLSELKYLNCVIQETLRKYPGVGWLDRIPSIDYKVDDNLTIPAGTPICINSIGMHYDPKYYPEPESFMPDRFLANNNSHDRPFLPFGEGPRHCIGRRVGLHSLRYAIASLILNFEFHPLPNTPKPSECKFEKKHLLIQPGELMTVNFVRRSPFGIVKLS